jgi:lipopolysaccharide/colanic/teichoic acid biosynthesis glycosyltransferase
LPGELEKTGTDLCVSPALLDVAGPRTTIRPTAGLTLLYVDHPQLGGFRRVLKGLFDRCGAIAALIMLAPVMAVVAATIRLHDGGPALFTQLRVGKDGHPFRIYKFRTMVMDAEQRRAQLLANNDLDGVLFKLRQGSPRHRRASASAALVP